MTSFPSLKEPLTLEQLKTFRENFEITFAEELNGPDWHGYYTTYSIPDFSLSWANETEHNFVKKEFVNYSSALTGEQEPKKIDQKLLEIEQDLSKNPGQVYRVTPTEEAIERGERLAEEQKIESAESKASAEAKTQAFIKSQEKLYFNLPKKANIPELSPDEETKIRQLIEEKVKPNPTYYADSLAKEIVKQNKTPQMSRGEVKILKANAKLVAITHTNNLLGLESKEETVGDVAKLVWAKNPIHVAASLANPENPIVGKETAKSAQITALTIEHDNLIARKLLSKVVDPKTLSFFYPGSNELIIYEVSDKENKETAISVDRKAFTDQGIKLGESNNQVFNFVKENLWGEIKDRSWGFLDKTLNNTPWYSKAKSLVPDFLKPNIPVVAAGESVQPGLSLLWSKQGIQLLSGDMPTLLSSSFGKSIFLTPNFGLQFGKFVTTEGITGQFFGINFGDFGVKIVHFGEEAALDILKQLRIVEGVPRVAAAGEIVTTTGKIIAPAIGKGVATGAAEVAVGAAAKTGLSATISAFLSNTFGALAPIVGHILGAIAGWAAGKIIEPIANWIKRHQEDLKILGLVMLGGGALVNSIPIVVIGGLIFVPIALKTGFAMAGIAARTAFLFGRIGASMAITIGTPIIVAIIVFPILVAIILFIINSGAYIVPPSATSYLQGYDNPYLFVTKKAEPDRMVNPTGAQTVTYTVTITALKSALTNVKIASTSCKVIKKDKSSVNCPIENTPGLPADLTISPATPYSFSFTADFGPGLSDSLVLDSIEISADSPEETGIRSTGSETVCVGDCSTECIKVADNAIPWPSNLRSNMESAASGLTSRFPNFTAKVCAGGSEVNLCYNPPQISAGSFAWHVHNQFGDGCDVYFNEKGVGSTPNALFMMTHELTHHTQYLSGEAESEYEQHGAIQELPLCTYAATNGSAIEGSAEACGLYVSIPSWGGCVGDYKSHYPKNYLFAKDFME